MSQEKIESPKIENYPVVFNCSQQEFKNFLSGILGKPQTIVKNFFGAFDINFGDIENFYHLILQRITQQNAGTLISFTAKIIYDDNSSIQLNSFDDLHNYKEIRPIVSDCIILTWVFLVHFSDKPAPEKQEISVYDCDRWATI